MKHPRRDAGPRWRGSSTPAIEQINGKFPVFFRRIKTVRHRTERATAGTYLFRHGLHHVQTSSISRSRDFGMFPGLKQEADRSHEGFGRKTTVASFQFAVEGWRNLSEKNEESFSRFLQLPELLVIAGCSVPGAAARTRAVELTAARLGPASVNLGNAAGINGGTFAILAKTKITTTGVTAITGDLGLSPAAESYYAGFGQCARFEQPLLNVISCDGENIRLGHGSPDTCKHDDGNIRHADGVRGRGWPRNTRLHRAVCGRHQRTDPGSWTVQVGHGRSRSIRTSRLRAPQLTPGYSRLLRT